MIYGYANKTINEFGLLEMREVSFSASPAVLREIAKFLDEMAAGMESSGELSVHWHRHIQDEIPGWRDRFPDNDIVVCAPGKV